MRSAGQTLRRIGATLLRIGLPIGSIVCLAGGCATPDLLRGPVPVHPDRTIHVVVENPAGTQEKWEVRADGRLIQEKNEAGPIEIPYLPWPVNSGMIPRTLHAADLGGDGEPLDVLLLGPAVPRGSVVRARPIGLLNVIDGLERDDKILAVQDGTPLAAAEDVSDLEAKFPGVHLQLMTWFANSRPGGRMQVQGYGSRAAAARLINDGVVAFDEAEKSGELPEWVTP